MPEEWSGVLPLMTGFSIRTPDKRTIKYTKPDADELAMWADEGGCETPDGCWVEPDGICEHGHKSWLLIMGMI